MTAKNFIDRISHESILKSVKSQSDFEYRKEFGKCKIDIGSSHAGCDWESGVKNGEYIVHVGFTKTHGDYSGSGCAYSVKDFMQRAASYEMLLAYIESNLKHIGVELTEDMQTTLF